MWSRLAAAGVFVAFAFGAWVVSVLMGGEPLDARLSDDGSREGSLAIAYLILAGLTVLVPGAWLRAVPAFAWPARIGTVAALNALAAWVGKSHNFPTSMGEYPPQAIALLVLAGIVLVAALATAIAPAKTTRPANPATRAGASSPP